MKQAAPLTQAEVLFDGMLSSPRLDHAESVVVAGDGALWCGGEHGQIYRIAGDQIEQVASTDGFHLGVAFLDEETLAVCDIARPAVWLLDVPSGHLTALPAPIDGHELLTPNAVAPLPDGSFLVSDSGIPHTPRPGLLRYTRTGEGKLWFEEPLDFANGLALSPDARVLYVAESWSHQIRAIDVDPETLRPTGSSVYAELPDLVPDGLCVDADGVLYVGCYEPSLVLRIPAPGTIEVLAHDDTAHTLCHPTGVAARDGELVVANLGRWHLSSIPLVSTPRDSEQRP